MCEGKKSGAVSTERRVYVDGKKTGVESWDNEFGLIDKVGNDACFHFSTCVGTVLDLLTDTGFV